MLEGGQSQLGVQESQGALGVARQRLIINHDKPMSVVTIECFLRRVPREAYGAAPSSHLLQTGINSSGVLRLHQFRKQKMIVTDDPFKLTHAPGELPNAHEDADGREELGESIHFATPK